MNNSNKSIFKDIYYQPYKNNRLKLFDHAKDNIDLVQRLGLLKKLAVHDGCVNTLSWNHTGEYILSGSDDQRLVITNGHNYKVLVNYSTGHHANIFSAKFLPCCDDKQIVSCSGDGNIIHTDLEKPKETYNNQFSCHVGTTYEVITIPNDPNSFLSCGEDGTARLFDLRIRTSCNKQKCKDDILVSNKSAITALAISPMTPHHLAVGCSDSTVRIYDRRFLSTSEGEAARARPFCTFTSPDLEDRPYRITSLSYSSDAQDMLVSYSCDHLYLFCTRDQYCTELKKPTKVRSNWSKVRALTGKRERRSPPPVRRLRLRGDWSDTGPDARPERESNSSVSIISQARPQLQGTLMQRMTNVLSRMLNDPMTRAALSAGGEDSLDPISENQNPQNLPARNNQSPAQEASAATSESSTSEAVNTGEAAPVSSAPAATEEASAENVNIQDAQGSTSSLSTHTSTTTTEDCVFGNSGDNESEGELMDTSESTPEESASNQHSTTSTPINTSIVTRHLRDRLSMLRSLRQGFIDQHGSEPSVSLRYSDQSTSNSTISLRVGRSFISTEEAFETPSTSGSTASDLTKKLESSDVELDYDLGDESEYEYEEPIYEATQQKKYIGHRNARTMIKEATFWGNDYVMSGSDCGHIFIWDRNTTKLKMLLQADNHVVNCLQPHPSLPLLATSGIDHDIKLWAPTLEQPMFDAELAENLISRNAIMLEETRDTITVPASFMIRMLACLNQIRQGARSRMRPREDE